MCEPNISLQYMVKLRVCDNLFSELIAVFFFFSQLTLYGSAKPSIQKKVLGVDLHNQASMTDFDKSSLKADLDALVMMLIKYSTSCDCCHRESAIPEDKSINISILSISASTVSCLYSQPRVVNSGYEGMKSIRVVALA